MIVSSANSLPILPYKQQGYNKPAMLELANIRRQLKKYGLYTYTF